MGFASAVTAYLHMLITVLSSQGTELLKQGLQHFSCLFMPSPAIPGGYNGHIKSGFCLLTMLSGYPHLVFAESDMCLQEQASSIAPDKIFLVSCFPNLISTLKSISMLLLLPCSFYNISVGQIVHVELEMAAPFPHWMGNAGSPQHRSVLFVADLGQAGWTDCS